MFADKGMTALGWLTTSRTLERQGGRGGAGGARTHL